MTAPTSRDAAREIVADYLNRPGATWLYCEERIAQAIDKARADALNEAIHAVICTPKYPASDHDAHQRAVAAIRQLKPSGAP